VNGHTANNRDLWDGWTEIHRCSSFYDLPAFRAGASTLNPIELEAVGDVAGRNLLHLQCHFGLDTLSWARLGAHVTGVDFSSRAIELARSLAVELGIDAEFTCADVCDLPADWNSRFDTVFTSYGVLPWLPDLLPWAQTIARVLRPGGSFHIVEFHPIATMLDDDGRHLRHPYFHSVEPMKAELEGSYADPAAPFTHTSFEWAHSLSEIQMALMEAGLEIQGFHEYPYSPYGCYPYLEERSAGRWMVRDSEIDLPLVFRIHALV
jgi:SAM-dependent methyltransferase